MNPSAPEQIQPQDAQGVPPQIQTPTTAAPARPGLRGIWANPEECDTSAWNTFYYYYRQIAQHMFSSRLKNLKWIAIITQIYFFGNSLFLLVLFKPDLKTSVRMLFSMIMIPPILILYAVLTLVPVVMVTQAFKLRTRNVGFIVSRQKETPVLSHLAEYTSCVGLVEGVMQSAVYTYLKLLLFLLPAFFFSILAAAVFSPWMVLLAVAALPLSLVVANFLTLQMFTYRLDTLGFFLLFLFETAIGISRCGSLVSKLLIDGNEMSFSFVFFFCLFCLVRFALIWTVCMVYFPLATADTFEYGLGRHARTVRIFLSGVVLINLAQFLIHWGLTSSGIEGMSVSDTDIFSLMPCLWIFLGIVGMLISSLSAASFRAKNSFLRHAAAAKNKLAVRLFDPGSPGSAIPVLILEIVVVLLLMLPSAGTQLHRYQAIRDLSFTGLWIWSSVQFALMIMQFIRRRSPTEEKKPWLTHPMFNATVFAILAFLGLPWLLSQYNPALPLFYMAMSGMGLFILWEPLNEPMSSLIPDDPAGGPPHTGRRES